MPRWRCWHSASSASGVARVLPKKISKQLFELPRRLVSALKTIGPVHVQANGHYVFEVRLIVTGDDEPAGFLIEQRWADRGEQPVPEGQGMSFRVPARAQAGGEATWVYAETLGEVMEYIGR